MERDDTMPFLTETGESNRVSDQWRGMIGRHLRQVLVLAAIFIGWAIVSWLLVEKLVSEKSARLIEREQNVASATAASVGANVGITLAHIRNIPKVLARESGIEAVLSRIGPRVQRSSLPIPQFRNILTKDRDLAEIGKRLESIVTELGVDQILIMNAAGDCIASVGFPEGSSPNGVNYLDRDYFQMAKRSGYGRQYAVGRTSNTPGIFYSAGVVVKNQFLGIVVVKIEIVRLSWMMVLDANTFVSDENGVVIIAGDPRYFMKKVPGAIVGTLTESEQENRYKRHKFDELEMNPLEVNGALLTRLEGRGAPMIEAVSNPQSDLLTVRVFRDMSELWRIRNEGLWVFVLLFFAGSSVIASLIALAAHLRRGKAHQAEIARVNAELVKLNDDLLVQAQFDALTGCINRRHFFAELENELKRARRFNLSCCLAMLDIDHFKSVNDQHGHTAGDALLKRFSKTVGECLRSSDMLGRIGGEEFALLMPQTSLAGARELSERIRSAVECSSALAGSADVSFTVSIGVVQWAGGEETEAALIDRADNAMYTAKHAGRNRVSVG